MSNHLRTEEDVLALMAGMAATHKPHPGPGGFYSPEGDCIFFSIRNVPSVAERVDSVLTVYLDREDESKLVGVQIKGIKKMLARAKGRFTFVVTERDGQKMVPILQLLVMSLKHTSVDPGHAPEREARYMDAIKSVDEYSGIEAEELSGALA